MGLDDMEISESNMTDVTTDLDHFHTKFGFEQRKPGEVPNQALIAFRVKFLVEELTELTKALNRRDMAKTLDALVDLTYVAVGTAWMLGLPFASAWREVHDANMNKVRATSESESIRGGLLDVIKPPGWKRPDISALIDPEDLKLLILLIPTPEGEQLDLIKCIDELKGHDS